MNDGLVRVADAIDASCFDVLALASWGQSWTYVGISFYMCLPEYLPHREVPPLESEMFPWYSDTTFLFQNVDNPDNPCR